MSPCWLKSQETKIPSLIPQRKFSVEFLQISSRNLVFFSMLTGGRSFLGKWPKWLQQNQRHSRYSFAQSWHSLWLLGMAWSFWRQTEPQKNSSRFLNETQLVSGGKALKSIRPVANCKETPLRTIAEFSMISSATTPMFSPSLIFSPGDKAPRFLLAKTVSIS